MPWTAADIPSQAGRVAVVTGATSGLGYAATMPDLPGGAFVGPDGLLEQRGHPKLVSARRAARDEAVARRLWEVSEQLTGVRYLS